MSVGTATSTDFDCVFENGLNDWWVKCMGREHFAAFGIQYSGGLQRDGHPQATHVHAHSSEEEKACMMEVGLCASCPLGTEHG